MQGQYKVHHGFLSLASIFKKMICLKHIIVPSLKFPDSDCNDWIPLLTYLQAEVVNLWPYIYSQFQISNRKHSLTLILLVCLLLRAELMCIYVW